MSAVFLTLELPDAAATEALGRALARHLGPGDVVALWGDLGAGKTTLARALIRALPGPPGSADERVPSPTFTLVQLYERTVAPVWHFDLYRLRSGEEVWELGWEEALAGGLLLIEWPERLGSLLPAATLSLTLEPAAGGARRRASFAGLPAWSDRLGNLTLDG